MTPLSPRDQAALELATAEGFLTVPSPDDTTELTPARAVALALSRHLGRLSARVENPNGPATSAKFELVLDGWPSGQEVSQYPALLCRDRIITTLDAISGTPEVIDDQDVVSADGAWALWRLGEDTGEMMVHAFALEQATRDALGQALEQALTGGQPDRLQGLGLPLPEDALPPPFRELLDVAQLPRAYVALREGAKPVGDEEATQGGVWRADLVVAWQAPRWAARRARPDLKTDITVQVGLPGQETTP